MSTIQRIAMLATNHAPGTKTRQLGLRGVCFSDGGAGIVDFSKPFLLSAATLPGFLKYAAATWNDQEFDGFKFVINLSDNTIAIGSAKLAHLNIATRVWGEDKAFMQASFSGGGISIRSFGGPFLTTSLCGSSGFYDCGDGGGTKRAKPEITVFRQKVADALTSAAKECGITAQLAFADNDYIQLEIDLS